LHFFAVIVKTTFFHDRFGVEQFQQLPLNGPNPGWNDPILHSIIYLQVSTISQALIFVTRSRSFFFMERPSLILVSAFMVAQLVATLIAVYANWPFTSLQGCGWSWAGIVWIWNIVWFFPLDLVKFALRAYFDPLQKKVVEETLQSQPSTDEQRTRRRSTIGANTSATPLPSRRSTTASVGSGRSRRDTLAQATAKYYAPHTRNLSTSHHHRNFARMLAGDSNNPVKISADADDLRRFSLVQAHHASKLLGADSGNAKRQTTAV
jgi:H+-transporting ATPase